MAFVSKLVNPTPWEVKLDYDRGIKIRVPAFDSVDLTMQQMDDYRPDKPGSEAVQSVLDTYGLFLLDADRPYDNQALEALKKMHKVLADKRASVERNLRDSRSAQGINPDEEAIQATLNQMGYGRVKIQIDTLKKQIETLENTVGPERKVRSKLDPERTVFVTEPPREFPSVAAMNFFLEENPDIKAEHDSFVARQEAARKEATTVPAPQEQ